MNRILLPLLLAIPLSLISYFLLASWGKLRVGMSLLVTLGITLGSTATVFWRAYRMFNRHMDPPPETAFIIFACTALLIIFGVPLGIKLYRAWTGIQVSPEEKAPGAVGVRAWLTPGNLIVSAIVAGCAAGAYDYPFFGVLSLLISLLLIQPMVNTATVPAPASAPEPTLTAEREKVLSLLEMGRISAEESADLLNALGSTSQPPRTSPSVSRHQRMTMIGGGLVLLGFMLPWLSINPGKELARATGQVQGMIEGFSGGVSMQAMPTISTQTLNLSGGDMAHGLGWLILLLGIGVAALPHMNQLLDQATRRLVSFIALGIGGIALLWLITQNLRFLNVGVVLALAGYAVEFLGLLNPRPRTAAESGLPVAGVP